MTCTMTLMLRQQGSGRDVASEADASRTLQHVDVMKAVKAPQSLKDRDGWERFVFQVETYLAFIDGEMPVQLDRCRKATAFLDPEQMPDPMKDRSRKLFAMLASWIQECLAAAKLSRGIRNQNGFELWRLLWREFQPENHSKSLIWRRTLLSPKFPAREAEFSSAELCRNGKRTWTDTNRSTAGRKPSAMKTSEQWSSLKLQRHGANTWQCTLVR